MATLELTDYEEIVEGIQDAFVVVDKHIRFIYVNKKAEELIGFSKDDLIGHTFAKAFPQHNLNVVSLLKIVKKAWIEKKPATLELYFKPQQRWYLLFVYPFKDKFSVIFRDISKRKEVEGELENVKKQLDVLFKNVSDGIVIQDASGKIIYANNAAVSLSGFSNKNHILSNPDFPIVSKFDIFDEYRRPISWDLAPERQVIAQKRESAEAVLCFVDKITKEELWLNVRSSKATLQNESICAISILHDITKLKRIEQQKDNFLSLVSHELKTPLTSMKLYVQLLEKYCQQINDTKAHVLITKIEKNTNRLIELIHSLLDISRIQDGKLLLRKHRFSMKLLVKEVIEDIQPLTTHDIRLLSADNAYIYADRERISQVISNLLTNAMKYSDSKKKIIITITLKRDVLVTAVKDFGIGISLKDQKEVFDRFFQSDGQTTFPGLGLGLYISSEIIKGHGGRIWVKSREGKGSTFSFTLPLHNKKSSSGKYSL